MEEEQERDVSWSSQLEKTISSEGEKALSYFWLHDRCQKKFTRLDTWLNVPVIILSTLAGSASIGSDSLFKGFEQASVVIGIVSIMVGIMQTLNSYFGFGKRSEGHRISAIQYSKSYNFIKIEMSLQREQRLPAKEFLKIIKDQFERLREISPQISDDVIEAYKHNFSSYTDVSKPEICNGLDSIEVYTPTTVEKDTNTEENKPPEPEIPPIVEKIEGMIPKPPRVWK